MSDTIDRPPETHDGCPVRFYDTATPRPALSFFAEGDAVREELPFFWNPQAQGYWVLTRYEAVRDALQDADVFTSESFIPTDPDPTYHMIPTQESGGRHRAFRHLLNPQFSPTAVAAMEPMMRRLCNESIDAFIADGNCDLVAQFGCTFPTKVFLSWAGLPASELPMFIGWVETVFDHLHDSGDDALQQAMESIHNYFGSLIADRRVNPRDPSTDVVTHLVQATVEGAPISDDDLLSLCEVLVLAGLDTVRQELGYSFLYLATHPHDRERIVDEPELIPSAIEELLRFFPVAPPARKLAADVELHGCPMRAGDMVWLPIYMANRDPRVFPDADTVVLDRASNRHLAFGAGPHRCQGSHFARMQLKVAFEEWHRRIPDYRLGDGPIHEHGGQLGLDRLPLVWDMPT